MNQPNKCRPAPLGAYRALVAASCLAVFGSSDTLGQWKQFGGPGQAFKADGGKLASDWPDQGPPTIWRRELGEGYSGILADSGRLFTMYRAEDKERIVSLDAATGKTLWEHGYDAEPREGHGKKYGIGPRATPLLTGGRLYTIGMAGLMHCLDATDGKVLWSHDLAKEFGANALFGGHASSPIEYKDNIIALVGGKGASIVAFQKKDGNVAWKNLSFPNSYCTPRIMKIHGQDQLVAFMGSEVIGADPDNGDLKWQFPCQNEWKENIALPLLVDEDTVLISSVQVGTYALKIVQTGSRFEAQKAWFTKKIQFYHGNSVQVGDYVYASSGLRAPHFIAAFNGKTGKIAWRERGFAKANVLLADGRLIILDEDGNLALATATPQDLVIHSKVKLLEKVAWTAPTVVGRKLYVRDQSHILALDLS
ncbi:MAG: PQQ-binding-like beta-propeller repeat protein [Phycisphaerae bacterium]